MRMSCWAVSSRRAPLRGLVRSLPLEATYSYEWTNEEANAAEKAPDQRQREGKPCVHCGALRAKKKCAACMRVRYCDKPCQKAHWHVHKHLCLQCK